MSKRERSESTGAQSTDKKKRGRVEKDDGHTSNDKMDADGVTKNGETGLEEGLENLAFEDPFEDDFEEESVDEEAAVQGDDEDEEKEDIENEKGMEERFKEEEEAQNPEEEEEEEKPQTKVHRFCLTLILTTCRCIFPKKGLNQGKNLRWIQMLMICYTFSRWNGHA